MDKPISDSHNDQYLLEAFYVSGLTWTSVPEPHPLPVWLLSTGNAARLT